MQTLQLAWNVLWQIAALTGVVSVALAALVTWLLMRSTKMLDSYTDAVAKQIVRHQNLEKLVEETRRLTAVAETIKAELAHENWDRQTRFIAKRDLYVSVAEALAGLRDTYIRGKGMQRVEFAASIPREFLTPDQTEQLKSIEAARLKWPDALEEASDKWSHACALAPLMMPDEAFNPLVNFTPRRIRFRTPEWEKDFDYNIRSLQWALYHFQVAARADLGFTPMEWKPIILTSPPPEAEDSTGGQQQE